MENRYHIAYSDSAADPAWDSFLEETPGGDHVQSSLWARLKSGERGDFLRVLLFEGQRIVAGAQAVIRKVIGPLSVGYVPKGPVFAIEAGALYSLLLDELERAALRRRILYFAIQPPDNGFSLVPYLLARGYSEASLELASTATAVVDLSPEPEEILARMKRQTRYNIGLSQRRGVTVRAGTPTDLETYSRLLDATSQRQEFSRYPISYYERMFHIFEPSGHARLFLAEYQGEVVSAQIAIPFGNTVHNKLTVWSGKHKDVRANEALLWAVMKWARQNGYRYYDLEGLDWETARAVLEGRALPEHLQQSVDSFKLGFGGQVRVAPQPCETILHPTLRWIYFRMYKKTRLGRMLRQIARRLRTQSHG